MSNYLIAKKPAPLLNTPDFKQEFGSASLPLDSQGLLRPLEMIALPGTVFKMIIKINRYTFEVTTGDYPHGPVYIDSRFTTSSLEKLPERKKSLPPRETILSRLRNSLGLPYVWGGNWGRGISEIRSLYSPTIPAKLEPIWTLSGLDCSGLLYEATDGYTPRNTSELLTFGELIPSIDALKELDMIVWSGHVMILLSSTILIESLYGKGVILTPLKKRLIELQSTKLLIRRFISNN